MSDTTKSGTASGGSESNYKPDGTGVVMGDTAPMPDRGTSTGLTGFDTHNDMSIDPDATNTMGKISGTGSDPMAECYTEDNPPVGNSGSDTAEDKSEGY